ncbi:hypothetical protein GN958_ATG11872 [Phytophthora infestans]|uniref:Uncharacterized protein n=2 Tax=Phytophthora infestans TaxID=4787 RepID=A0A8S9UCT5_PHYIN|nr:hypothetical protein GN958_ATG11872 [Phytophthora infestans]
MTPTISLIFGFQEHDELPHKNPSILAEYLDDDDWEENVKLRRRSSSVEIALSSCFASLSSSLNAVTAHVKQLYSGDSPRLGRQLCNSVMEVPSVQPQRLLARANSMPVAYRSSESDLDLFGNENEYPGESCLLKTEAPPASTPSRGKL